jgi:hypothetical protein
MDVYIFTRLPRPLPLHLDTALKLETKVHRSITEQTMQIESEASGM